MIQKLLWLLLAWITLTGISLAQDILAESAKQAYENGQYAEAIVLLTQLTKSDIRSEHYVNLAAAHQQLSQNGYALVNYLRAQYLNPRSQEIQNRIDLLQSRIPASLYNQQDTLTSIRDTFNRLLTWNEHRWLFMLVWVPFCLITALRMFRAQLRTLQSIQILLAFITILTALTIGIRFLADQRGLQAIVIDESVTVYSGPATDYLELYTIYEAEDITVVEIRDQWLRFIKRGNRTGWIPENAIEYVLPSDWRSDLIPITPPSE
jgi:hypothetical protein